MQCGAPVPPPESLRSESAAPQPQLNFIQPAIAGGMFLGFLSSIPIISAGNLICCMWVVGGGGIAGFLLAKQRPGGISYGDGAFVGVLSGLFGAIVATIISIPVRIISAQVFDSQQQAIEEWLQQAGIEGSLHDLLLRLASPEISAVTVIFTFLLNLIVFALFAMVGGILVLAILKRRKVEMR